MPISDSYTRGAYHISNNTVEYNPQRKNNFNLIINGLGDLPRVYSIDQSMGDLGDVDIIRNGQEQVSLSLRSCTTPVVTQNPIEINRGNSTIKFAGKPTFNTITIEAYDYIGSDAKDTLLAWQYLSYNGRYDYVGSAWNYKKDCQLLQLTPDGTLVRYWDIKGAWVQSVTPGDFNMDSGDEPQTWQAELVYDFATMRLSDELSI